MKKRFIQKIVAISLILTMQATPLCYAAESETDWQGGASTQLSEEGEHLENIVQQDETVTQEEVEDANFPETDVADISEETNASVNTESSENLDIYESTDNVGEAETAEKKVVAEETGTVGWYRQGDEYYYYDEPGIKAYGWRAIGGVWYYFDQENVEKPGIMLASTKRVIAGQTYFFGANGAMRKGWIRESEGWYYARDNGAMATGWLLLGNTWYYLDEANEEYPGLMVENCKKIIGNATYFFYPSGAMYTGWVLRPEGWYYAKDNGAMATGWLLLGNTWYYLDRANEVYPGLMVANCKKIIGNATYFFYPSGAMRTGWIKDAEGYYYGDKNGSTGWKYVGNAWYYLDGANEEYPGLMVENCKKTIGNATYFFYPSGAMYTGWVLRPEGWYYTNNSGAMLTGWQWIGTDWYYLDAANEEYPGLMIANCKKEINGNTYYFNPSGSMKTGWLRDGENWYYINIYGLFASGWNYVGSDWYYLDPSNGNKMLSNGWYVINGAKYYLNVSGSMAKEWLLLGDEWYYLGADGSMKTGWQLVNGRWYYMYKANDPYGGKEGVMAKNTVIDGYELSDTGAMYNEAELAARNVLNSIGWDLRAAFNWSAGLTYYQMTADPSPGSEWFANYGFQNRRGNCYVMAATFCYMARMLGYEAHQMAGYVPTISGGMTPHSWCEVVIGGTTYVFDPDFTYETGRNGYQITYGTSGTWVYSSYYRMN